MKFRIYFLVMLVFMITCVCTACNCNDTKISVSENTSTPTEVRLEEPSTPTEIQLEKTICFDSSTLIDEYCNGNWDGAFISNESHCASIENGKLWIDCVVSDGIPDMKLYDDYSCYSIIDSNADGTWIYDKDTNVLELWKKGNRLNKISIFTDFPSYTTIYVLEQAIIANCGHTLQIYDYNSFLLISYYNIIDCYKAQDYVLFSNFHHKNFKITESGIVEELDTNYVRFHKDNVTLSLDSNPLLTQIHHLYYTTDWNGSFRKIDNNFIIVADNGNVIVNNKLIGNVSLKNYTFSSVSSNLSISNEFSFWLNGKELVVFNRGTQTCIDILDGNAEILNISNEHGIIAIVYGNHTNTLLIIKNNESRIISSDIIDAYVSNDIIYYMIKDTVYTYDLTDSNPTSNIYFEGAFAVSHYDGKAAGAIVPNSKANFEAYGYNNIYNK